MLGCPDTAEDVAQEAILRLIRKGSDGVTDDSSARRWLFVVARNLCLSHLRRNARRPEVSLDACPETPSREPGPAEVASGEERRNMIKAAIGRLSPPLRETLILREYEEMSYAEIADVLGCSIGTVKSRLARARNDLRGYLRPLLEQEQ